MTPNENPMKHPDEPEAGGDGVPHFGRLVILLVAVVALIGVMTFASVAYFSP